MQSQNTIVEIIVMLMLHVSRFPQRFSYLPKGPPHTSQIERGQTSDSLVRRSGWLALTLAKMKNQIQKKVSSNTSSSSHCESQSINRDESLSCDYLQ